MVAVAVKAAAEFSTGPSLRLFDRPVGSTLLGVSPGGQEFMMSAGQRSTAAGTPYIRVIQDSSEELKRIVPRQ